MREPIFRFRGVDRWTVIAVRWCQSPDVQSCSLRQGRAARSDRPARGGEKRRDRRHRQVQRLPQGARVLGRRYAGDQHAGRRIDPVPTGKPDRRARTRDDQERRRQSPTRWMLGRGCCRYPCRPRRNSKGRAAIDPTIRPQATSRRRDPTWRGIVQPVRPPPAGSRRTDISRIVALPRRRRMENRPA